jgi:hypothetical protein
MRKLAKLAAFSGILASLAGFWGCQAGGPTPTGIVTLRITDAPVDNPDIDGVWLTIGEVQYNLSGEDSGWQSFGDFVGPQKVNLLDYQNGLAFLLGSLVLPSGQYEQIRFLLEITDEGAKVPPATPGCFVSFKDGSEAALFVPSGLQTGYKAVGRFEVPANGIVNLTADFDRHKSLRLTPGGTCCSRRSGWRWTSRRGRSRGPSPTCLPSRSGCSPMWMARMRIRRRSRSRSSSPTRRPVRPWTRGPKPTRSPSCPRACMTSWWLRSTPTPA